MNKKAIYVTKPSLPPLKDFKSLLDEIWEKQWLTNNGEFHEDFEEELRNYLKVDYFSLVSNGTLALLIAIKALGRKGEIITTPFTFAATIHAIEWLGCTPVFCDINQNDLNIDTNKIEALITKNTIAILPVHVFGFPCDMAKLETIANKNNLKVIYDAAHAFNIKRDNEIILNQGDYSTISFHATKSFNTIEGGGIISHSVEDKKKIDQLRNFGYNDSNIVELSGINAKMNELQAAYGLLQLKESDAQIKKRKRVFEIYSEKLNSVEGIALPKIENNLTHNYSYFPIRVNSNYKISRELLVSFMNVEEIFPRKYFYPLVSNMKPYCNNKSGGIDKLPVANVLAEQILCLPIYESLSEEDQQRIINIILKSHG